MNCIKIKFCIQFKFIQNSALLFILKNTSLIKNRNEMKPL